MLELETRYQKQTTTGIASSVDGTKKPTPLFIAEVLATILNYNNSLPGLVTKGKTRDHV